MFSARLKDILVPSETLAHQLDAQYRLALGQLLRDVTSAHRSPPVIFSKMRGAFPSDVVEYGADLKAQSQSPSDHAVIQHSPQLHALHYEWYFTPSGANEISREFVSSRTVTVCMGVPTVASAAIREHKAVIFIDKNAQSLVRFPELMHASEIHIMDAARAGGVGPKADVLIFDPPWYAADTIAWLEAASHLVRPGGTIVFALYPSLVRPTAMLERDLILEIASALGNVGVMEDALAYETPFFEHEALKACGVYAGDWRHGDLVVIKDVMPVGSLFSSAPCRAEIDGSWKTFLIGPQVVKLRNRSTRSADVLLSPIGDSFIFPAVSARNGTRDRIHVWTSKNRVAGVGNTQALSDILNEIAGGACLDSAVQRHERRFGIDIRVQLNEFLGLES
jgi:hypothetical protein